MLNHQNDPKDCGSYQIAEIIPTFIGTLLIHPTVLFDVAGYISMARNSEMMNW